MKTFRKGSFRGLTPCEMKDQPNPEAAAIDIATPMDCCLASKNLLGASVGQRNRAGS